MQIHDIDINNSYSIIHLHTDYSNGITNIDSVTKYDEYIDYISKNKNLGINNLCFTEHGSIFEWFKKKTHLEEMGFKYVHSIEAYVTESLEEKKRDNYHICLFAKNYEGFKELNTIITKSFNRNDGHFYYTPRITFEELLATSDNIIITTACLGGILNKGDNDLQKRFIDFLSLNKHRSYLEIQHHIVLDQIEYNKKLYELSKIYDIPLIVGTDTHALNDTHLKGRNILQKAKNIFFNDEKDWDLKIKSYNELIECFKNQNSIPICEIKKALFNTNVLINSIEEFKCDKSYKYPKLWNNPKEELLKKIKKGILEKGINKYSNYKTEYIPRINYELKTYEYNGAFDFLLLDEDVKSYARSINILPGYSRGSCSGSIIAYLIGLTEIDSVKRKLNFERFMNKERVSLADIDTDYPPNRIDEIKEYLYNKHGLYCADIITFNTVALKGSIRDVCRALYKKTPTQEMIKKMDNDVEGYGKLTDKTSEYVLEYVQGKYIEVSNYICENIETNESKMRKEYPEVFEYVDIINGTIVSIGTHPCGLLVYDNKLDDVIGLCSLSTCKYPVTMLSMKPIDKLNYVKLDLLKLDSIQIINETCEMIGIERINPETASDEEKIWLSMAEDNTLIFQWESDSAGHFLEKLLSKSTLDKIRKVNPNFKYKDLVSMGNGAIRPAGASYRESLSNGEFRDNGHIALNEFLSPTMGYLVYQEQIIEFLHSFCGYTMGEADIVRRGFSKKTGTEEFIPKIKEGFIKTMKEKYETTQKESEKLIINFIKIIEDASDYLFSLNHSEPYTYIGYIEAWLRYYYPLEYLTSGLNICSNNEDKLANIIRYCGKVGIKINPPKFRYSKAKYFPNKETNSIYKGISSIKYLNSNIAEELYLLKDREFNCFSDLLYTIQNETSANIKQINILIKLNYFSEFGRNKKLLNISDFYFQKLKNKNLKETTRLKRLLETKLYESQLEDTSLDVQNQLISEMEFYGYATTTKSTIPDNVYFVLDLNMNYTPEISLYKIKDGSIIKVKCNKKDLESNCFVKGNIFILQGVKEKPKRMLVDGHYVANPNEKNVFMTKWKVLK